MTTVSAIGHVYLFQMGEFYKIGRSKNVAQRLRSFGTLPYKCVLVHTIQSENSSLIEQCLHRRFKDQRERGEWFRLEADDVRLLQ